MTIIFLKKCLKCPSFRKCRSQDFFAIFPSQKPCKLGKLNTKNSRYYDLVRVPHGHIPAPKVKLWNRLPIPVKELRQGDYYECPRCGEPSFFKIEEMCWSCEEDVQWGSYSEAYEKEQWMAFRVRIRRKYFKNLWKRIEYLMLPILVLSNRAWYVRSTRGHMRDLDACMQ